MKRKSHFSPHIMSNHESFHAQALNQSSNKYKTMTDNLFVEPTNNSGGYFDHKSLHYTSVQ
jgi:hypothetical protein